jgi:CheY-like chemotaxis protein
MLPYRRAGRRQLGFTSFRTAVTQQEAIAAASDQRPDLITACSRLPDGSGTEAVGIICAETSIPTVYVVSNPGVGEEVLAGTVVVAKPIDRRALQRAVQEAIEGSLHA